MNPSIFCFSLFILFLSFFCRYHPNKNLPSGHTILSDLQYLFLYLTIHLLDRFLIEIFCAYAHKICSFLFHQSNIN
jgi:hypothetical protein